ncbi:MAG: methyltransferase domain-containing protein [Ignavibacteria bacterium]|nr:methyltransferase domain-containing protein [Ignavibacteria bacterium]
MNNHKIKTRSCPNCGSNEFRIVLTEGEFIIVRCSKCSLVYLQNIPDEKNIYEDYYDIEYSGKDYCADSEFGNLRDVYEINNQRIKYLKKFKQSGKLLDTGSGAGLFLKTASDNGYDVSGIDVSVKAVEFSEREFGLNASNKTADDLISENCKFDIISLWHVCEHFINPVNELKKIHRLLENDGICIIEVPNFNSVKFRLSGSKWQGGNHPLYHRSFFTEKTLRDTLRRSGFTKFRRLNISYKLPGKSPVYNASKFIFNLFAMDAFLDFVAWK